MVRYIFQERTGTFERIPKYIYQRKNGWFEIRKRVGDVLLYWGSFPTLEEACLHKAYYIGKKWEVDPSFKANRHITQVGDRFILVKSIDGHRVNFGTFRDLESARHERDVCVECQWDFDRIVEWED